MGQNTPRKVVIKKLIGFDQEMLSALQKYMKGKLGKDETDVLRKLLGGQERFRPAIEAYLSEMETKTAYTRHELIEILILEALRLKDERYRLRQDYQSKQ